IRAYKVTGVQTCALPILARGYTLQQSAMLEPLRVSDSVYADAQRARNQLDQSTHTLEFLEVEGSTHVDQRVIRRHIAERPGDAIDGERLRRDITKVYGLDACAVVTYR